MAVGRGGDKCLNISTSAARAGRITKKRAISARRSFAGGKKTTSGYLRLPAFSFSFFIVFSFFRENRTRPNDDSESVRRPRVPGFARAADPTGFEIRTEKSIVRRLRLPFRCYNKKTVIIICYLSQYFDRYGDMVISYMY